MTSRVNLSKESGGILLTISSRKKEIACVRIIVFCFIWKMSSAEEKTSRAMKRRREKKGKGERRERRERGEKSSPSVVVSLHPLSVKFAFFHRQNQRTCIPLLLSTLSRLLFLILSCLLFPCRVLLSPSPLLFLLILVTLLLFRRSSLPLNRFLLFLLHIGLFSFKKGEDYQRLCERRCGPPCFVLS